MKELCANANRKPVNIRITEEPSAILVGGFTTLYSDQIQQANKTASKPKIAYAIDNLWLDVVRVKCADLEM